MWYTTEPNTFFQQDIFLMRFEPMTILPDLSDLVIEQVRMTTEVTIAVRAASPAAPCPCCGTISKRIQSRYRRTVRDRPVSVFLVTVSERVAPPASAPEPDMKVVPSSGSSVYGQLRLIPALARSA